MSVVFLIGRIILGGYFFTQVFTILRAWSIWQDTRR